MFLLLLLYIVCAYTANISYYSWPEDGPATVGDSHKEFDDNMSGAAYVDTMEAWAVQNKPSTLYLLAKNSTTNLWNIQQSPIKIFYPDGSSDPDSEDVTLTNENDIVYVSIEESNAIEISQPGVLRYNVNNVSADTTELLATHFWDLTDLLPTAEANKGLEGITWIEDKFLTDHSFFDDNTHTLYDPKYYPDHGDGLFFVGLEENGNIYAVALMGMEGNQTSATVVQTVNGQYDKIMSLEFDETNGYLWGGCDNHCDLNMTIYIVSDGRFEAVAVLAPPEGLNISQNIEGFAIQPLDDESAKYKQVTWTDDDCTNGHALYEGTIPVGDFLDISAT